MRDANRRLNRMEQMPLTFSLEGFRSALREPSIVDRVGGLGSSKLAARNAAYDKLAAEREAMLKAIAGASNEIHKRTVRSPANWIRTSPAIAKILDPTGEHSEEIDMRGLNL